MTDVTDLGYGAYVVGRSGRRWAVCWRGCKSERHGVEFGGEAVSFCVW